MGQGARKKIRVGLVGCGTIGAQIALACEGRLKGKIELAAICDADEANAMKLRTQLKSRPRILKLNDLVKKCSLVVEAASAKISGDVLKKCVSAGNGCMIMSVGGLIGRENLIAAARKKGAAVYIPSGAIAGVDALKSASTGSIDSVTLTTRKPPKGLAGAPYLKAKGIDVSAITEETVLFDGNVEEAIAGFPQNINVSAILSIAGLGAKRTKVRIVTSPDYTKNTHEVEIVGEAGRILTRTENVPSKTNPKTSELAVFSAIATLAQIADSVRIGT